MKANFRTSKLISVVIAFIMGLQIAVIPSFAAGEEIVAEVVLSAQPNMKNFKSTVYGGAAVPVVTTRNGRECWLLDVSNGNPEIRFDLEDDFASCVSDGSAFKLEIEYFDEGEGFFQLVYDSYEVASKWNVDFVYTQNTEAWKTAEFYITDGYFGGRCSGADFKITAKTFASGTNGGKSQASIPIRSVRVTKEVAKNPIYVSSETDELGNIFSWFSESKIIHNKFHSFSDKEENIKVKYKAVDRDEIILFEKEDTLSIKPGEDVVSDLDIGEFTKCQLYDYYVSIIGDGFQSEFLVTEFSIVKTDPDGIKNMDFGYCLPQVGGAAHEALTVEGLTQTETQLRLLDKSNCGLIRHTLSWWSVEREKGVLAISDVTKDFYKKLSERGMKTIPFLGEMSYFHEQPMLRLPKNDDEIAQCARYAAFVAEEMGDSIHCFEYYNEPNHTGFNANAKNELGDGKAYMKTFKAVVEAIKEKKPDAKVVGMGMAGAAMNDYYMDAVSAGLADYSDGYSVHPYGGKASKESIAQLETIQNMKSVFEENGSKDFKLVITEDGYTVTDDITENEQGAFTLRGYLSFKANQLLDSFCVYTLVLKGNVTGLFREDGFGWVTPYTPESNRYSKTTMAYPAYVMSAGHNYIMAQSEGNGVVETSSSDAYVYKFKSHKFDSDIVTAYSNNQRQNIVLDMGTTSLKYFDIYGNETKLYSEDGIYKFTLGDVPIYLVGDFGDVKEASDTTDIQCDFLSFEGVSTDTAEIEIKSKNNKNYRIETEESNIAEAADVSDFTDGTAKIKLFIKGKKGDEGMLKIKLYENDKLIHLAEYPVIVKDMIDSSVSVSLPSTAMAGKWTGNIRIKNISASKPVGGYVEFTSPENYKKLGKIDIGYIPREAQAEINIPLPELKKAGQQTLRYNVVLNNGESYSFDKKVDFTVGLYANTKPKIDGILEKTEWNKVSGMYVDSKEDVIFSKTTWGGKEDLSGCCMIMWDEDNLYVGAEVLDNICYQQNPENQLFVSDSIQIGVFYGAEGYVAQGQKSATFHEIALGKTPDGERAYRHLSQDNLYNSGLLENYELVVKRDEETKKTVYEFKIPWKNLLREGDNPKEGDILGFSYLINDNDGNGRRGWIEYASGIGSYKNTELFTYLKLLKEGEGNK